MVTDIYMQKLRNGTFILPTTGERVRRQITLRNPANFDGSAGQGSNDGVDPLLPLRRTRSYPQAGTFRTVMDDTVESAKEFWEYLKTPTAKGILKCSLAVSSYPATSRDSQEPSFVTSSKREGIFGLGSSRHLL